jgi:alpha-amylase/alpha-mannosidase (GH57 family)
MVKLAILWHMHQPYYQDLVTGEHVLPWVRLHAVKDYVGMVDVLKEFPGVRVTFNLVPSLIVQVQAFAENRAKDRHLDVSLMPADALTPEDRAFLVAHAFDAPEDRMIRPNPRYAQLYAGRHAPATYSIDDLRDLQVWEKLAWMDPDWLAQDRRLVALVKKGSRFSEADKLTLREIELELLRGVIPAYIGAAERDQIELSTSPFYHPILPLLCDTDAHFRAHPQSPLLHGLFRWPDDAREQLARAMRLHRGVFGRDARGIWPSEGSVSDAAVALIAETGVAWIASDEAILARSLNQTLSADLLYRPYEVGDAARPVRCLFRDHALSDLIGFTYQSWEAVSAADDFVRRIEEAGQTSAADDPVVTVILDGENAWEHYAGGGRPFLRALYSRLERSSTVRTVTMSEAASGPAKRLDSVFPGSWINNDFYIWAGHPDDHRAWGQLAAARAAFATDGATVPAVDRERAYEELLIAEGSDWFWWYGDDHSSSYDREFDDLFRRHLRNVYDALSQRVPDALYVSNITTVRDTGPVKPRAFMTALIDGQITGFAEWAAAVPAALGAGGGAMHRTASDLVRDVALGVSSTELFIRIAGERFAAGLSTGDFGLAILVGGTAARRLDLLPHTNGHRGRVAAAAIVEVALSFDDLGMRPGQRLSLTVLVTNATGHVVEQHPAGQAVEIEVPAPDLELTNWAV